MLETRHSRSALRLLHDKTVSNVLLSVIRICFEFRISSLPFGLGSFAFACDGAEDVHQLGRFLDQSAASLLHGRLLPGIE